MTDRREYYKQYNAKRNSNLEYKAKQAEWNKQWRDNNKDDPTIRARKAEQMRGYADKFPERHSARYKLRNAIESGKIAPLPCEVCGDLKVHGHHHSYDMPLSVTWLCPTHHRQLHMEFKAKAQGDNNA